MDICLTISLFCIPETNTLCIKYTPIFFLILKEKKKRTKCEGLPKQIQILLWNSNNEDSLLLVEEWTYWLMEQSEVRNTLTYIGKWFFCLGSCFSVEMPSNLRVVVVMKNQLCSYIPAKKLLGSWNERKFYPTHEKYLCKN